MGKRRSVQVGETNRTVHSESAFMPHDRLLVPLTIAAPFWPGAFRQYPARHIVATARKQSPASGRGACIHLRGVAEAAGCKEHRLFPRLVKGRAGHAPCPTTNAFPCDVSQQRERSGLCVHHDRACAATLAYQLVRPGRQKLSKKSWLQGLEKIWAFQETVASQWRASIVTRLISPATSG